MHSKKHDKTKTLGKFSFFLIGVSSLIGWNSMLTALDFFNTQYGGSFNVYFYMPVPYFFVATATCILIYPISQHISLKNRINYGFILLGICMIMLPVFAVFIEGSAGFVIGMVLCGFFGVFNQAGQASSVAFASSFPHDNFVSLFFTGTGIGGCIIGVLRAICLVSFGDNKRGNQIGTVVFFSVATLVIVLSLVINNMFSKSIYCKYHLKLAGMQSKFYNKSFFGSLIMPVDSINNSDANNMVASNEERQALKDKIHKLQALENQNFSEQDLLQEDQEQYNTKRIQQPINSESLIDQEHKTINPLAYQDDQEDAQIKDEDEDEEEEGNERSFRFFWKAFKKVWLVFTLIFLNYVITFITYPGVSIQKEKINYLSDAWKLTIMVFIYNINDTLGKYFIEIPHFPPYQMKYSVICFFFRLIPLGLQFWFIRSSGGFLTEGWVAMITMGIFALSNGYLTSSLFTLGPRGVKNNYKEAVGFLLSAALIGGICAGTFLALAFKQVDSIQPGPSSN